MPAVIKNKVWLCLPPFIFCLLDQGVTLWSQSEEYWGGNYDDALEGNPLMRRLLSQHPMAFEAGLVGWMLLFLLAIGFLPRRLAMTLSVGITFGHLWGAVSWIMYAALYGYWICLALMFGAALLIVLAWENYAGTGE